ncbi:MAG TPA: serine/threonine-protein kinase [Verrucomicrobiae bacterium]|nr:serine/threonine-protein kinase [Verrucomicrobiae bacterium]
MDPRAKTVVIHALVGQTLNQYRIEGLLGQGGMGEVYRAHDLKLQRSVALKLLPPELTGDPERRKRFLLEARAAARITHPAIAQVYDVDEHEGTIFIAMELVEGKTIRDVISSRELDLLGAIDIALQVAAGLAKAHGAGIVHRDIKPANVIQTPDGHVKILDFGLAKLLHPDTSTATSAPGVHDLSTLTHTQVGAVKGTPAYMSPEQVKGETIDARSDLFSLGVMLFEMATWEVPFRRPTPLETMHALAFDSTPTMNSFRPNLPADLQRIVSRCLKKRPEDRYPDARALIEELRVLRRETESGLVRRLSLKERMGDTFDRLTHLRPSEYAWLAGGILAVAGFIYLLVANVGLLFPLIPFAFIGLLIYRDIRNKPRKMLDLFVRKVARIPEVRFIVCEDRKITVGVDRAIGQLYGRINNQLNYCNRKLFFGQPLSVVIRHDLTSDETRQMLTGVGVRYVRDDAVQGG